MKLIFENWRKYLNEELLNEVSFEDVKQRFNSKKFRRAVERLDDQSPFAQHAKHLRIEPAELIPKYVPNDISEKDKAEALNWLISIFHREDGPAVEWPNGTKRWYLNGKLHREGGPAVEDANGTKFWYLNGKLHREDGPAVEYPTAQRSGI
jgi:hypothetical protein